MNVRNDLVQGLRDGFPIGLGYAPVAFTFGFIAVSGGLPLWAAALISLTNLTSAGQFAGTNLILQGAGYIEVAMTTFVINIRYMLMSLSLGQRLEKGTGILSRMGFGFGITDETFVMASLKPGILRAPYLFGLILFPILGWNLGTVLGGSISTVLPPECHGDRFIRYVHCADRTGLPGFPSCISDRCDGSGGQLYAEIYPCIFLYLPGLPDHPVHGGWSRTGSGPVPQG